MARLRWRRITAKAKPRINRADKLAPPDASAYCSNLPNWPRSWMGVEKDLPSGEGLVACFRPFIEHLVSRGLSPKTIRKHVDNLWALGGEIVRDLNYDPKLRKKTAEQLLMAAVHDDGGPLLYHGSEQEQRSVDSTCRKLYRFLTTTRL